MDKNLDKLEEDQERAGVCEGDRVHQRLSSQEEDQTHLRSRIKEGDQLQPDGDRADLCVKPKQAAALFWKF